MSRLPFRYRYPDEQTAKVCRVRDTRTAAEREEQGHPAEDHHEVSRLDREDEEHQERPGWEVEREGHQQAVDRTGGADRRRVVELIGEWERQDAEQHLREAGADVRDAK